jgi:hypothetical protein
MASEREDMRLVEKALQTGKISHKQYAESLRVRDALEAQGVKKGLVEILADDGALSKKDLEQLDDASLVGQTLGGFLIEAKLGEGGMGAVYRAKQISLGRAVALKVLAPQHGADPEFVGRFVREARSAARLNHPYVVQPLEIGAEKGFHFFAMELCEGGSVASRIDRRGRFPEPDALEVIRAVGLALSYASELGMIHRDIKPDNILFTRTGITKLADLGLAKDRSETHQLTMTGLILGTPNYMPPEQALGKKDLDIRGDIYALGITLFEMVTGRVPFKGDTPLIVMNQHVNEPLPDPRSIVPDLSEDLVRLIRRMTEKDRDLRFRSPRDLVVECERVLGMKPSFNIEETAPPTRAGTRPGGEARRGSPGKAPAAERDAARTLKTEADLAAPRRAPAAQAETRPQGASGAARAAPAKRRSRAEDLAAETMNLPPADRPEAAPPRRAAREKDERATIAIEASRPRRGLRVATAILLLTAVGATVLAARPDLRARALAASRTLYGRLARARPGPSGGNPRPARLAAPAGAAADPYVELGEDEEATAAPELAQGGDAAAAAPAPAPTPPEDTAAEREARRLLDDGDRAEAAGDVPGAIKTFRAALLQYDKTAAVHARQSELLVRTGYLEAIERLGEANYRGALECIASLPPGPSVPAEEEAVRAVCLAGDALRADLETVVRALAAMEATQWADATSLLNDLKARASPPFVKVSGQEVAAMFAFAAASDAAVRGGASAARPLATRLQGDLAKTAFLRSHEAGVRALLARIDVEPRLPQILHASATPAGEPRWRFLYPFARAKAAGLVDPDLLADWHVEKGYFVDDEGLGFKAASDGPKSPPASIEIPFARLDEVEIELAPAKMAAFYFDVGPLQVIVLHREGRIGAAIGKPIIPIVEQAAEGRPRAEKTLSLPKSTAQAAAPVKLDGTYRLRVTFTRGAAAGDAVRAEISVNDAPVLAIGGMGEGSALPPGLFHGRLVFRIHPGIHPNVRVRSVSLAGVPDWPALKNHKK